MTIEQLIALAPHLPSGTEINISFRLGADKHLQTPDVGRTSERAVSAAEPERLTVDEAAKRFPMSKRELIRAKQAGFLPFTVKADGKDNGTHLMALEELERYAERRQAIQDFREDPPENWPGPGGRS